VRSLRALALGGAVLMTVLFPLAYWQLGTQRLGAEIRAKAEIKADLLGQMITQRPDLWQFEQSRLEYLLSRSAGAAESGVIRNGDGRVIAEIGPHLDRPVIEAVVPIFDAGVAVGSLTLSQSANELAWRTGALALIGAVLGVASYWLFVSGPLRILELATQALGESEERLRLFIDGTKDYAFAMLDPQGRVMSWNEGARRIMGYEPDDVVGRHFSLFYTSVDIAAGKPDRQLERALDSGMCEDEGQRVRKDGTCFWSSCMITPLFDETGTLRGFSKIDRDITERREAEAGRALLEDRLHRSHKMEALGRMAGRIAHEINNVLQPIMSHTSLASHACAGNEEARAHLAKIKESIRHGRMIVRSVLAVAGGQGMVRQPCVLEDEVARVMGLIAVTIRPDIVVEAILRPTLGTVSLSPTELFQMLENLVANSVDAIVSAGRIQVITGRVDLDGQQAARVGAKPGPYAELLVTDTGCGMDDSTLLRAFDPFYTTKPLNRGSGLGLSTVRTLVEGMDGRIQISSSVGQGTQARVIFPLLP
jgi:PAS domain S-box-containing protein